MKRVRIRLVDVGGAFGTEARLIALNGREIASTETLPYMFDTAAECAGRDIAAAKGWQVVGVIPARRN